MHFDQLLNSCYGEPCCPGITNTEIKNKLKLVNKIKLSSSKRLFPEIINDKFKLILFYLIGYQKIHTNLHPQVIIEAIVDSMNCN